MIDLTAALDKALQAPTLKPLARLAVDVGPPVEVGETMLGRRRYIPILGGRVSGGLSGKVLPGGADFQVIPSPTLALLDARYAIELDDGARIFVKNDAMRRASTDDIARLIRGEPVDPSRVYFRCVPKFETGDPRYTWLMENVFIGTAARFPDAVHLAFFQVL